MNDTPHGKISRLPHHIREQLHFRLRDGQRAKLILAWLNATAEVQQIMAVEFAARPISQRNLSQWKQRSHPAWLLQQAALSQASRFISPSSQLVHAVHAVHAVHPVHLVRSVRSDQSVPNPPSIPSHYFRLFPSKSH